MKTFEIKLFLGITAYSNLFHPNQVLKLYKSI